MYFTHGNRFIEYKLYNAINIYNLSNIDYDINQKSLQIQKSD